MPRRVVLTAQQAGAQKQMCSFFDGRCCRLARWLHSVGPMLELHLHVREEEEEVVVTPTHFGRLLKLSKRIRVFLLLEQIIARFEVRI
jgi:hypothetical protein